MGKDNIAVDSPVSTINTPIIMGFLTYLYMPVITSFFVGLQGARVPFPIFIKLIMFGMIIINPEIMRINPVTNVEKCFIDKSFSIQKGTSINTIKGSMKEIRFFKTIFIPV